MVIEAIQAILLGIGAGITYALTGYAKKQGENFNWMKFGTTIIIGTVIGIISTVTSFDMATVYAYIINIGAIAFVENVLKALKRKMWVPFVNWLKNRKKNKK